MKILVIEDEASIQDRVVRLTRKCLGDKLSLITTADSIAEGLSILRYERIDLLLLDLNVNGEDGFDVLRELATQSFHTVVISAYPERAIEAYNLGVVDFITKPFDEVRLGRAFSRVLGEEESSREHFAKFLAVKKLDMIELLALQDICYIQADGGYSQVFLENGHHYMHDKMLKNISILLPPTFERIHKSYIVNLKRMTGIKSRGNHKHYAVIDDKHEIPLSRSKFKELKEHIGL